MTRTCFVSWRLARLFFRLATAHHGRHNSHVFHLFSGAREVAAAHLFMRAPLRFIFCSDAFHRRRHVVGVGASWQPRRRPAERFGWPAKPKPKKQPAANLTGSWSPQSTRHEEENHTLSTCQSKENSGGGSGKTSETQKTRTTRDPAHRPKPQTFFVLECAVTMLFLGALLPRRRRRPLRLRPRPLSVCSTIDVVFVFSFQFPGCGRGRLELARRLSCRPLGLQANATVPQDIDIIGTFSSAPTRNEPTRQTQARQTRPERERKTIAYLFVHLDVESVRHFVILHRAER